ncbi:hypothetical protein LZ198_06385 [Myxococcus sp. K15C18031901]|uniref:hypothetical protein n=1 Tax=Myxococcus dinghuensis TaxID=2906761 RepID=UPI0020A781EC|nr:hypothetical protein [Myxococcus dinghuensis]MCP3098504.1 hypothetical protein [Myxococcus dinghuensis]
MRWGLAALLVGSILLVAFVLSRASGWSRLARRQPRCGAGGWGRVGWIDYRSCLVVGGDARGLYLVPVLPFRPFHPPLRIPGSEGWSRTHDNACFLLDVVRFDVGSGMPRLQLQPSATRSFDAYRASST